MWALMSMDPFDDHGLVLGLDNLATSTLHCICSVIGVLNISRLLHFKFIKRDGNFLFFFVGFQLSVVIVSRMLSLLLSLVGEILGTTIARLVATVARADGLLYNVGNAARAGGASAGIFLVTGADILLYDVGDAARAGGASAGIFLMTDADVLLYDVSDAARAGGASAGIFLMTDADGLLCLFGEVLDDAWVLTYRHAGVTKGCTVNGDSHVAATEASHGP